MWQVNRRLPLTGKGPHLSPSPGWELGAPLPRWLSLRQSLQALPATGPWLFRGRLTRVQSEPSGAQAWCEVRHLRPLRDGQRLMVHTQTWQDPSSRPYRVSGRDVLPLDNTSARPVLRTPLKKGGMSGHSWGRGLWLPLYSPPHTHISWLQASGEEAGAPQWQYS